MPTNTPNYNLWLYDSGADTAQTALSYRDNQSGPGANSNMVKIDTGMKAIADTVTALSALKGAVTVTAVSAATNYYEATIPAITVYTGTTINLGINVSVVTGTPVTLKINSLAVVTLKKITTAGAVTDIEGGDLVLNRRYYFMFDGTYYIWINANSSDQINIQGTAGNFTKISATKGISDSTYSQTSFILATEKAAASGVASLNGSTLVVQNPANATATPTASKIVIADGSGLVDGWVSDATTSVKGKASFNTAHFTVSSGAVSINSTKLDSNIYTPTLFNTTNITASTAIGCRYFRIGDYVIVQGIVQVQPTATASTVLGFSLPIASALSVSTQLSGMGVSGTGLPQVTITCDTGNDRATFTFTATSTANQTITFYFSYQVI
jgi:hypothetical protein